MQPAGAAERVTVEVVQQIRRAHRQGRVAALPTVLPVHGFSPRAAARGGGIGAVPNAVNAELGWRRLGRPGMKAASEGRSRGGSRQSWKSRTNPAANRFAWPL